MAQTREEHAESRHRDRLYSFNTGFSLNGDHFHDGRSCSLGMDPCPCSCPLGCSDVAQTDYPAAPRSHPSAGLHSPRPPARKITTAEAELQRKALQFWRSLRLIIRSQHEIDHRPSHRHVKPDWKNPCRNPAMLGSLIGKSVDETKQDEGQAHGS